MATALTDDLTGELIFEAGEIDGAIFGRFGDFDLAASFDALLLQASNVIDQTTGAVTLADGSASINLITPLGELSGAGALSDIGEILSNNPGLVA